MDFNQVRYFLALADTLNFTHASEICFISQSALTQAIKRMENELGGDLFIRDGRKTQLSSLGKSLRGHFESIDFTRNKVKETARTMTSNQFKELHIGVMCTIGPNLIAKLLQDFRLDQPDLSVVLHDVTQQHIPGLLSSGVIDGAFCTRHGFAEADKFRYLKLYQEEMVVAFSKHHELAKLTSIPLNLVAQYPYIDRLKCEFRDDFLKFCKSEQLKLKVVFSSQREDWIQQMVQQDIGISVIPELSLINADLDFRSISQPELNRQIEFVILAQNQISTELEKLFEFIETHSIQQK